MKSARHAPPGLALVLTLLALPLPAYAYLDPGTGSMILSALIGLFATAALAAKTWWYRIKSLFSRQGPVTERTADEADQPVDERNPAGGQ